MKNDNHISLTELQALIRDSIFLAHPSSYWVTAEISDYKVNSAGHAYMELIDKAGEKDEVKAKLRGIIWSGKLRSIKPYFENSTGIELSSGLKVLLKCTVEYHELYGLSLLITDIDPAYTAGEALTRRREIMNRLKSEGVVAMNQGLTLPLLTQRIAVISSKNAAGYIDFINQLSGNKFNYSFSTELFASAMQGSETEEGIVNALNAISERLDEFDIVAIVRGGGSATDLSWFDNYNIAFHITQFPLPVITGIGHDIDISVTDLVSFKHLKTPTAAAEYLISLMQDTDEFINQKVKAIAQLSVSHLNSRKIANEANYNRLRNLTDRYNILLKSKLEKFAIYLNRTTGKNFTGYKHKLDLYKQTIASLSPEVILKRGYSITMKNGKLITSVSQLSIGEEVQTILKDGKFTSTVSKK